MIPNTPESPTTSCALGVESRGEAGLGERMWGVTGWAGQWIDKMTSAELGSGWELNGAGVVVHWVKPPLLAATCYITVPIVFLAILFPLQPPASAP